MRIDYATHPAYEEFEGEEIPVDVSNLDRIESCFVGAIRDHEPSRAANQVAESIVEVFGELASGLTDSKSIKFFQLLQSEVLRLASSELACRQRSLHDPSISLKPALGMGRFVSGRLSAASLNSILKLAKFHEQELLARFTGGSRTREELSISSGGRVDQISAILQREFRANGVLESLENYFGQSIVVGGAALELSPVGDWWNGVFDCNQSTKTLYCHVDERIDLPKAIVYLTEVSEENGPFSVFPNVFEEMSIGLISRWIGRVVGSIKLPDESVSDFPAPSYHQPFSSPFIRRMFMKLPTDLRFSSHFGWDVLQGTAIEKSLVDSELVFLGPPGTFICFDGGELVHRGGLSKSGYRLALQVVFNRKFSFGEKLRYKIAHSRQAF